MRPKVGSTPFRRYRSMMFFSVADIFGYLLALSASSLGRSRVQAAAFFLATVCPLDVLGVAELEKKHRMFAQNPGCDAVPNGFKRCIRNRIPAKNILKKTMILLISLVTFISVSPRIRVLLRQVCFFAALVNLEVLWSWDQR